MNIDKKPIKGKECKFSVHIPTRDPDIPDFHYIKERIHYEDGTTEPNVRIVKNFKRSYWVTKPSKRSFTQKKEYMLVDDLLEKKVTQSDLRISIARALEKQWSRDSLKSLCSSPYIYGADISSTSLIKKQYKTTYPECVSEFTVAGLDIETDVINGTEDVIIISIIYKDKAFLAVVKDFVRYIANPEQRFQEICNVYLKEYLDKHKITPEIYVANSSLDAITKVFEKAHLWQPDFMEIWNIDFDITKIIESIKRSGADPSDILCDPKIPKELRICKYIRGTQKKITASGNVQPINPAAQWHTLQLTASFYVIDGMCAYKQIRLMSEQEQTSYSLDNILQKELGIRKLKFKEADAYTGLSWHKFMQTNHKIEYLVYNLFDSLSMLELDQKTLDLSYTLPNFAATTDFSRFNSQPTRIADELHHFLLERNKVIGSTGKSSYDSDEDESLDLKGWIEYSFYYKKL